MPKTATPSRNTFAKEDLTRSSAARFENLHRYRAAFGRCRPSAYKDHGLEYLRLAEQFRNSNPEYAQSCLARLPMTLVAAIEITQRR